MANEKIKLFDKFYVGTQQIWRSNDPVTGEKIIDNLAFLTQETGDAEDTKRKQTVQDWVGFSNFKWGTYDRSNYVPGQPCPLIVPTEEEVIKYEEDHFFTLDNVPTTGFSLDRVTHRYRTNNKLFRVNDPRGFQFEISAENLMVIMNYLTIEKGEIKEPLIYGKLGGKIALTWEGYEGNYVEAGKTVMNVKGADKLKKIKREKLKVGDKFMSQSSNYIYAGSVPFVTGRMVSLHRNNVRETNYHRWNYTYNWRPRDLVDVVKEKFDIDPYFEAIVKQYGNFTKYATYEEADNDSFAVYVFGEENYDVALGIDYKGIYDIDNKTVNFISSGNEIDFSKVSGPSYLGHYQSRPRYQMYQPLHSKEKFTAALRLPHYRGELIHFDDKYALAVKPNGLYW